MLREWIRTRWAKTANGSLSFACLTDEITKLFEEYNILSSTPVERSVEEGLEFTTNVTFLGWVIAYEAAMSVFDYSENHV